MSAQGLWLRAYGIVWLKAFGRSRWLMARLQGAGGMS
jgi:hypothetical protein